MKVAFFNYLPLEYGGGSAKYFIDITENLSYRYKDLDLSIVTFAEEFAQKILFLYSIYYGQKYKQKTNSFYKNLVNIRYFKANSISQLRKILAGFNIIYSKNDILELSILKYLVKYNNLPPVIIGCHTTLKFFRLTSFQATIHNFLYNSFFYISLINKAAKIHCLNSDEERIIKHMLPSKTVVKISNPFDFTGFRQNAKAYPYKYQLDKKKTNILWVGRFTREKGVGDLIKIINQINRSNLASDIAWNIVGDGELLKHILDCQRQWKNVFIFKYIPNRYLASIYKNSDIFLSTSSGEAYPFTLLEAQSFGLPVISYENFGTREIITENQTGYLVRTLSQFVDTLTYLIKHPKLKHNLISKYLQSKYHHEAIYKKLYQLLTG